jgi:DNA-binding response OmpR family regulator
MRSMLLADDSPVARLSVARRLRAAGLEVIEHATAATASAVDPGDLTCALLDLDLGDGWGTDVAAKLRERSETLPVAFFTTSTDGDAVARARTFGPVFTKPDDLDAAIAWAAAHAA